MNTRIVSCHMLLLYRLISRKRFLPWSAPFLSILLTFRRKSRWRDANRGRCRVEPVHGRLLRRAPPPGRPCLSSRSSPWVQKPGSARSTPRGFTMAAGQSEPPAASMSRYCSGKSLPVREIAAVQRAHQEVAEGVRVDVPGHVDEMRDVAPPDAVVLGERDAVAEHRPLRLQPHRRRSAPS